MVENIKNNKRVLYTLFQEMLLNSNHNLYLITKRNDCDVLFIHSIFLISFDNSKFPKN